MFKLVNDLSSSVVVLVMRGWVGGPLKPGFGLNGENNAVQRGLLFVRSRSKPTRSAVVVIVAVQDSQSPCRLEGI